MEWQTNKACFQLIGVVATLDNQIVSQRIEGAISSCNFSSLHVGVAHVEEHAVDVTHVAPVLVGELMVAGNRKERWVSNTLNLREQLTQPHLPSAHTATMESGVEPKAHMQGVPPGTSMRENDHSDEKYLGNWKVSKSHDTLGT